ncbi:hypothetical protein ACP4OV_026022 [Aristida adscensionis]
MMEAAGRRWSGFAARAAWRLRFRSWARKLRQRNLMRRVIRRIEAKRLLAKGIKAIVDMCCPCCSHGMVPKDHPTKFMLFVCTFCDHEKQLDFEFSWHQTEVNGIRVVPRVKDQGDEPLCVFYAVATALEGILKLRMAREEKCYKEHMSIAHFVEHFDKLVAQSSRPERMARGLRQFYACEELLQDEGVFTEKEYEKQDEEREDTNRVKIRKSRWHKGMAFEDACALILNGKMLVTLVPETQAFHNIGSNGIYECVKFDRGDKDKPKE